MSSSPNPLPPATTIPEFLAKLTQDKDLLQMWVLNRKEAIGSEALSEDDQALLLSGDVEAIRSASREEDAAFRWLTIWIV